MAETPQIDRICPYLRGRGGDVSLTPGEDNYCLLASSIHLPRAQQTRYCMGGHYRDCSRFQMQDGRPVPRYVRGTRPVQVRPSTPTLKLRTLPWRYPWVPSALKWLLILLLAALFIYLWQWRMHQTRPYVVERDPIPTPVASPAPDNPELYLPPTAGPPEW